MPTQLHIQGGGEEGDTNLLIIWRLSPSLPFLVKASHVLGNRGGWEGQALEPECSELNRAGDLSWAWRDKLSTATLAEEKAFHVEGKGISTEARVRQGVVDEGGRGVGILEFGSQLGTV